MKQVISEFGANARLVIRDFPLVEIHDNAMNAALAASAARRQNKFFEMADVMYRNQDDLDPASLARHAASIGLNVEQFQRDMKDPAALTEINKDIADGKAYGVNGTPAIYVNGVRLQRLSTGRLRYMIQNALK
jgi:protein-disulfide isomerase